MSLKNERSVWSVRNERSVGAKDRRSDSGVNVKNERSMNAKNEWLWRTLL